MLRRILHPTDFSETAFQAFGTAVALSKHHRADLELLHVLPTHDFAMIQLEKGHLLLDEAYEGIERTLKERGEELLAGDADERPWAQMIFRRGYSVAEEIIMEAVGREVDLIVMGTHGSAPVRQFLLGSVAEKVVRYAPCPVLVCGRSGRSQGRFERILVPVDFSDASRRAAELALRLARADGAALTFLHVIEDKPRPPYLAADGISLDDPSIREAAEIELRHYGSGFDTGGLTTAHVVVVGRPSREIAEHAEENGYDLVVMCTTGLRGVSRFLLGSTPSRVMRRCAVPVLMVHRHEDDEADDRQAPTEGADQLD